MQALSAQIGWSHRQVLLDRFADQPARLGAAWIDADTHQEFLRKILDDPALHVEHPGGAVWGVRANNRSIAATSEWGTERMPAPAIAKAVLEQRPIQVSDETFDGKRVVNPADYNRRLTRSSCATTAPRASA